jgi:pyruvate dehydrogenase E2 component (dihydrolipoamide acetyltransferase)
MPKEPDFKIIPQSRVREAIAERVSTTNREIPQFRFWVEVDASAMIAWRSQRKQAGPAPVPTFNDIIIHVVARRLREHPRLNAWLTPEGLKSFKQVNVGFAVATEAGVLLPTIYDADTRGLDEIAAEARELTEEARAGRLRATLQMNAGFTVSNIGPVGIDYFDAIISPPQTGILAVASIKERPVAREGKVVVRPTMILTLTVDHRAVDGADAPPFLTAVQKDLEAWGAPDER